MDGEFVGVVTDFGVEGSLELLSCIVDVEFCKGVSFLVDDILGFVDAVPVTPLSEGDLVDVVVGLPVVVVAVGAVVADPGVCINDLVDPDAAVVDGVGCVIMDCIEIAVAAVAKGACVGAAVLIIALVVEVDDWFRPCVEDTSSCLVVEIGSVVATVVDLGSNVSDVFCVDVKTFVPMSDVVCDA